MCNFVGDMEYSPHNLTSPRPALRPPRPLKGGEWLRIVVAVCLIFCFLAASAYNDHRNARVDSLEAALKSSNPPKGGDLLWAYDELMRGYLPYDSVKCEYYARKSLALSYRLNGLRCRQNALRHLGLIRYGSEEYDEAIGYFRQALAVVDTMVTDMRYTQGNIDDARSSIYGSIANVYNMQDKAHLAIHYYQLALPIFEKYDWKESQVILYYNIGELYGQMGNYAEAERNYLKAIEKGTASGDTLMMTFPKKGLVGVYFNTANYDKARQMVDEVLVYFKAHREDEPVDYATMLALKARILLMKGHEDVATAKTCIEEALPYIEKEIQFDDASTILMAACEVTMAEGRWQQALDYGLKSVHPDSTATYADKGGYMLLAEIYTELGQKEQARAYINKVYDMMNRYATDHYQRGLSQMEVLYETRQKEAQIAQLATERRQHLWLLGLAGALLVAMVIGYWLMVIVQRRQKALLAAKVALDTETKERRIMARDLHDSLGGMLSVLKLKVGNIAGQIQKLPSGTEHDAQNTLQSVDETLQLLDQTTKELRRVAHHLIPEELLQGGLRTALADFAIAIPGAQFHYYGNDAHRLSQDKELVLYRCAYELANNAIKHAAPKHIDIQLMVEEKQVELTVSNDINEERRMKNEKNNNGMGLQNIRERIEPYKGTLRIVSNEEKETEITVTLPL